MLVASDKLKMKVNKGAIMFADIFRILAGIFSKPVVLHAFWPLRVQATLSTSTCENFKNVRGLVNIIIYRQTANISAGLIIVFRCQLHSSAIDLGS